MSNRYDYDTLNVSLQPDNRDKQRLNKTIDASNRSEEESSKGQNDERVNKFKDLYYKNQKLRKQLKLLNEKLNEKLEKLKLPSVRKKAQSVDLNHVPPSKALQRQLQNAYKQVSMYKKQVETLKGKEQTPENYEKLRSTENMIGYMDMQINKVQEDLKSIKNVKKLQERVMNEDLESADLKQRLDDYKRQIKSFKDKLKDMDRKSRKREVQFRKQQAYLVQLETRLRKNHAEQKQDEKPELEKPKEVSEIEFKIVKDEIRFNKLENEQICKRIEAMKKSLKNTREQKTIVQEKMKEKEGLHKQLIIMVESFTRLLKDLQIKKYQQTGVREQNRDKYINKLLKLDQIEDQQEHGTVSQSKNRQLQFSKLSSIGGTTNQIQNSQFLNTQPLQQNNLQGQPPNSIQPNQNYQQPNQQMPVSGKDEREWKGKMRKVSMGYMTPTDQQFQQSGKLIGLKVFLDQNKIITGLASIMVANDQKYETRIVGNSTISELRWQVQHGDDLSRILGSFTEQGYLGQITLVTRNNLSARFGNPSSDAFQFNLQQGQLFTGIFGGIRKLGQDIRITEIGFWISKQ